MTTNRQRAEAILTARHHKDQLEGDGAVGCFDAAAAAAELHAAGLLTPDEPTNAPPNTLTEGSDWDTLTDLEKKMRRSNTNQFVIIDGPGRAHIYRNETWLQKRPFDTRPPFTILHIGNRR